MKNSTRLLVTHQRQFLPLCDRIVLMNEGRIEVLGTWKEVEAHPILKVVEQSSEHEEVIHRHHSPRASLNEALQVSLDAAEEAVNRAQTSSRNEDVGHVEKDESGDANDGDSSSAPGNISLHVSLS